MIQVINRALDIMEYIAREPDKPKPLGEIATDLKLNAGTCANIIKTLVIRKYLEKIDKQKGYCLGARAYEITGNEGYQKDLVNAAKEELEILTKKINENSLLCVLQGNTRAVVLRVQSKNDLQANTASEKKAYDTASGRLLVALLPETELEKYLEKYGLPSPEEWDGVTSIKTFRKQLNKIKEQGYAEQVTVNQIIGIALPVFKNGKAIAAVSVYMPVLRFNNLKKQDIIKLIGKATDKINRKLS
jgi:DNA-binding IclR family transcriptional regulator